jgi:peptidoglycan/xylan/chitin deacetylase (PgdA/CDA1 family)
MNVKPFFFTLSHGFRLSSYIRHIIRLKSPEIIFPFYHTISDKPLTHIGPLYHVKSVEKFTEEMDFLLRHFRPLHPSEFYTMVQECKPADKPSFLLSFDDGLSEFYHHIAPILMSKGIPAIQFLNPAFLDNKDMMFRYKIACLDNHYRHHSAEFSQAEVSDLLSPYKGENPVQKLWQIPFTDIHVLENIATCTGFSFGDYLSEKKPYLTLDQIKTLQKNGFVFGAHSMNHPHFSLLDEAEQLRQTRESSDEVSQITHEPCHFFSFPFTDGAAKKSFFESLNQSHPELFTFGTAGIKKELITRHFQRIPMDVHREGKDILTGEYLYYILKGLIGQNTLHRI